MLGIPFEPVGTRIAKLAEALTVLKGCFGDEEFSFAGEHYTITDYDAPPKPVQRPHPPIFVGGGGRRLLTLAGREAQIVGLAPRLVMDAQGKPGLDTASITFAATEEKIGWVRAAAGERFSEIELNTYPTAGPMVLTSNAKAEAALRADKIRERTGVELSVEEVLESPHVFIGTVEELTRKLLDLRERLGISSFLFDDMETLRADRRGASGTLSLFSFNARFGDGPYGGARDPDLGAGDRCNPHRGIQPGDFRGAVASRFRRARRRGALPRARPAQRPGTCLLDSVHRDRQ
jgi:alkanesulfonate monooxygenase SsuD/methylene tetrahydromethanopterin reductase-like flavin-dependent oxidoreductase (luciferase family)